MARFEVLTLGTDTWRQTADPPHWIIGQTPAHVNGYIYWTCVFNQGRVTPSNSFVRFSLADEEFSMVPHPPSKFRPERFTELEGQLCCVSLVEKGPVVPGMWLLTKEDDVYRLKPSDRWGRPTRKRGKNQGGWGEISCRVPVLSSDLANGGTASHRGGKEMAKRLREAAPWEEAPGSPVNGLDDGCLMHIFSFLSPIPGSELDFNFVDCVIALEFLSTCKIANLTIKAELGCCLLHRSGKLTIQECLLQCEPNPLDYLSFPIVSTAIEYNPLSSSLKEQQGHGVTVVRTRIEGGAKAVRTNGTLALQRVRAIYARRSVFFWFEVGEKLEPL
ncbi:hypothetical protein TRIUR3_14698 [Triticum urartu]|uniref:F-box associated beta-propeller type 3 domain-containing protein n=1 Tax=Triticum urartu TaxID=4572 RepID=M7YZM3_TRIUA|nr:hypothetical protein TRIUR3_14698 [Triticum urartu]